MAWVIVGVVVVAIVVAIVVLMRRRSSGPGDAEGAAPAEPPHASTDAPMTGLEAALAQVTDREGRPIGEAIDAEAPLVDELRVPDDTGPVLRRALDRVEHRDDDASPDDEARPAPDEAADDTADASDAADGDETG